VAILQITHNSEEQGNALADVLFGDYNPAGRLTQTWPASLDQLPAMMDYDIRHGRTYLYAKAKPLYAFGFGLSYTTFVYSNLQVSESAGNVHVKVTVANTGARDGDEVVQVYASHQGSKVARPAQELVAFSRVPLAVGQHKEIAFDVPSARLEYWDETSHRFVVEPDHVEFRVGGSSTDVRLSQTIAIALEQPKVGK
jgi:beta-glucosidase